MNEEFQCLDNCGECCQPIMMTRGYWEYVKASVVCEYEEILFEHNGEEYVVPHRVDGTPKCVFLDDHMRCAIYSERPQVCKEYGIVTECPFVRPDGSPRTAEESQRIGATICMKYALAATLLPESEQDLIGRLLKLDPLAMYEAVFDHGVRLGEHIRESGLGTTKIDIDVDLYPRLRTYLLGMGIHLEDPHDH